MRSSIARSLAPIAATALLSSAAVHAQPAARGPQAWVGCCGLAPWPDPGPVPSQPAERSLLFQGYGSVVPGSAIRHGVGLKGQIPAPYANLRNPLAASAQNAQRGAAVYAAQCAACHGATGLGDGPASRAHTPRPARLGWLAQLPSDRLDPFLYWSTVEGGAKYGTAMPSYKGKLSDPEIWSVIGYIEARLPKAKAAAR